MTISSSDNRSRSTSPAPGNTLPGHSFQKKAQQQPAAAEQASSKKGVKAAASQCELCMQAPCNCAALLQMALASGIPADQALPGLKKGKSTDEKAASSTVGVAGTATATQSFPTGSAQSAAYQSLGMSTPTGRVNAPQVASSMPKLDPAMIASQARLRA